MKREERREKMEVKRAGIAFVIEQVGPMTSEKGFAFVHLPR